MIPVTLTQGVTDGMADRPPNHTLEDVAEEILNGMFCTYEPPPPTRKPKKRGILRAPKMFRRNRSDQSSATKSVRWSDTHDDEEDVKEQEEEEVHPHLDFHCNMTGACLDAGIEAGCFSPSHKDTTSQADASEKKKKKSKSGRTKKLAEEIIFDEEGNPKSLLSGKIVPPPPPPPPKAKETFVPQLCGVKINYGEDEEHMNETAKSSREGPSKTYHRPKQEYDYEDDLDNSLVDEDMEEEDEAAIEERHKQQHQAILKRRMQKLREKQEKQRRKKSKQMARADEEEDDWDEERGSAVSGNSSFFRRVFYKKGGKEDDGQQVSSRGRAASTPSRSPSPARHANKAVSFDDEDELDPIQMVRAQKSTSKNLQSKLNSADDWDESLPIVPTRSPKVARRATSDGIVTQSYRQLRPTEVASGRSQSQIRDPSPGITRTRIRSADSKEEAKNSRWSLPSRSKSKSSRSKSPSRARSASPSQRSSQSGQDPLRVMVLNGRQGSLTQKAMEKFNYMHPAHPPSRQSDDALEKDSMIMAHRRGMDGTASSIVGTDIDQMDRQSFITAHRQGFMDDSYSTSSFARDGRARPRHAATQRGQTGAVYPMSQSSYRNYDDMLERQSFITESRQDMESMPTMRGCGLMDTITEDDRFTGKAQGAVHIANPASRRGVPLRQGPSHQELVDADMKARERIRKTLEALPDARQAQPNLPQYLHPQASSVTNQDESCCLSYCLPEDGVADTSSNLNVYEGPPGQNGQVLLPRAHVIDRQLQAQQQAQLQRQYYNRVKAQQQKRLGAPLGKSDKKHSKPQGRVRQKSAFSLPFFRRGRSRSPAAARSRSRSHSPSRGRVPQRRSRSVDQADSRSRVQARPVIATPQVPQFTGTGNFPNPSQLPTPEQQSLYQQQLAMQYQLMLQQAREQTLQAQRPTVEQQESKPEEKEEKETTWEERTKQAWERLRNGLTFETTKDEGAAEAISQADVPPATEAKSDEKPEVKSETTPNEQPSLLQSALAMLTSTPAKEEPKDEQVHPPENQKLSILGSPDASMGLQNQHPPVNMQPYPPMMMYPYQLGQGQVPMHQYPPWNQMSLQNPYQHFPFAVPPGSPPLQAQSQMMMQQQQGMMMSAQKPFGILKQPSFDNRRVTFGGRTEQTFVDNHDENAASPGKKKVFKGAKIITGLFGRTNLDQNKAVPSKEQSQGLQQTHTKSTDLSSCPSTYTLSEEWDGGPYLYSAGPISPHGLPSPHGRPLVDKNSVENDSLDPLAHLRLQVNRNKEGPQDPIGPIAV